jgi:hypothetical protein
LAIGTLAREAALSGGAFHGKEGLLPDKYADYVIFKEQSF